MKAIGPFIPVLAAAHKIKSFAGLNEEQVRAPWVGVDWRTMSGSQGFSVPFSRKRETDPFPRVGYWLTLGRDSKRRWVGERHEFPWAKEPVDLESLGETRCLKMLYHASYTAPAGDTVAYARIADLDTVLEVNSFNLRRRESNPDALATRRRKKMGASGATPRFARVLRLSCRLGSRQIWRGEGGATSTRRCSACRHNLL
jgi:hypothetical protein